MGYSISFHAVVVFGLGKDFLFKSILGRCGTYLNTEQRKFQTSKNRIELPTKNKEPFLVFLLYIFPHYYFFLSILGKQLTRPDKFEGK